MRNKLRELIGESFKKSRFRMHPNGFYQLDLAVGERCPPTRMHMWVPEPVKAQKNHNPIHNHTFSFDSFVLMGELTHREYSITPSQNGDGTHQLYNIVRGKSERTIMKPTGEIVSASKVGEGIFIAGERYSFGAGSFHESIGKPGELTVTLMRKYPDTRYSNPQVAGIKKYDTGDNDFERDKIDRSIPLKCLVTLLDTFDLKVLNAAIKFIDEPIRKVKNKA